MKWTSERAFYPASLAPVLSLFFFSFSLLRLNYKLLKKKSCCYKIPERGKNLYPNKNISLKLHVNHM